MRQPGILVRFAGTPLIACLLLAAEALVIYGWYLGHLVWWLAFLAAGFAVRTLSAVGTLRRYNAWRAEWDAMGRADRASSSGPKRQRWKPAVAAAVMLVALPALWSLPAVQDNTAVMTALHWAWLLLLLYGVFRVARGMLRSAGNIARRKREARIERSMDDPVELAVGPASGSPARGSAEKNLPDYCLRLMKHE